MRQITLPSGQLVNIDDKGNIIDSSGGIYTGGGAPVPVAQTQPVQNKTQELARIQDELNRIKEEALKLKQNQSTAPSPTPIIPSGITYIQNSDGMTYKLDINTKTLTKVNEVPAGVQVQYQGGSMSAADLRNKYGVSKGDETSALPDIIHPNDAIFASFLDSSGFTADDKTGLMNLFQASSKGDIAAYNRMVAAFQTGLTFSNPIFKAKAAMVLDALNQSFKSTAGDLAFKENQLKNTLADLEANTAASKDQLDFTHTQELKKLADSYKVDLENMQNNLAAVGKTSSSVRSKSEQLLSEQNQGLVESSNRSFAYNTGVQSRNLAATTRDTNLSLGYLTDKATQDRITALRKTEADIGTAGLAPLAGQYGFNSADLLGTTATPITSDLERQRKQEAIRWATGSFVF